MINRTIAPKYYDATSFELNLKPYELAYLDNNTPVYSINAGAEEVISIEFVFYAGNWFEKEHLVAATTNFLLKNGTSTKSAFEINELFEFYGAYLSRSCYNETASISLHCLSKHVQILLPIVAELIQDSIFPDKELEIYQKNNLQKLNVNLLKCDFVANRKIDEMLYGFEHPYGTYTRKEDLESLKKSHLEAFYQTYYINGNCKIFAAGKLPSDFLSILNNHFGKMNLKNEVDPLENIAHPIIRDVEKKAEILNDPNNVQGAIRIARPFPNRHHPDFQKVNVLNTIYGGYFGSRLMSNIREEKGYTYGIGSYLQNHVQESAWMISTEAKREACPMVLEEIWKEAKLLQDNLVDEEELSLVKNYMIGSILSSLDGPFSIISRWKGYILNGMDENTFQRNIAVVKSITSEELLELANKYLKEEDFYQLTVI